MDRLPGTRTMKVFRKDGASIRVTGVYDCALISLQVDLGKIFPAA